MRTEHKTPIRKPTVRGTYRRGAERRARRQFLQFMICGAAFVFLVAAKLWGPEHAANLRRTLSRAMDTNMDVQEVFSSVGRTFAGENAPAEGLREVWQAVFLPDGGGALTDADSGAGPLSDADAESVTETEATAAQLSESVATESASVTADAAVSGSADAGSAATTDAATASESGGDGRTLTPYHWESSFSNSTAFASLSEPWPDASVAAATAESAIAPPSDGDAFGDTHPDGQATILYTGQNLPENVGMQQVLLNFDYQCPVKGTLTSGFGYRQHPIDGAARFHYGADIAADTGTEIVCFADGVVTATGESSSFGKYCTVEHSGGFTTLYAHCSKVTAVSGAAVRMGDKLGEVGATGQATGPHLHFALQREGIYLNPVYYLVG